MQISCKSVESETERDAELQAELSCDRGGRATKKRSSMSEQESHRRGRQLRLLLNVRPEQRGRLSCECQFECALNATLQFESNWNRRGTLVEGATCKRNNGVTIKNNEAQAERGGGGENTCQGGKSETRMKTKQHDVG